MGELVIALTVLLVVWVAMLTAAVAYLAWRLQRANRVHPAHRTPAPLPWLWSPTQPARLHRRLRTAVQATAATAPPRRDERGPSTSIDELRVELEHHAVQLDQRVVVAARQPRPYRRDALAELRPQVAQLEALSVRLGRLRRPDGTPASGWDETTADALARITGHLDLFDEANRELTEIERSAGLDEIDALDALLARRMPPMPAVRPAPPAPELSRRSTPPPT
jgi:hypothetical protein